MSAPDTGEQVLKGLGLRLFQLYVLFGNPSEKWDIESEANQHVLAQHVEFLRDLERSGVMFMGGPFRATDYTWNGSGMLAVRAESLREAEEIAQRDPLVGKGLRTYEVRGWQLNEGQLRFTLELDSKRVDLA